jgi:CrcB protein
VHELALALGVAVAGGLGAPARYLVERAARARWAGAFPAGTFVVNVSGSLALGAVVGWTLEHGLDPDIRTVVGTGFLGAYTTFSAYAYEAIRVGECGQREVAVVYAVGSVIAASSAAAIGLLITGAW